MWVETKRVDGVVIYEGPANDTLVFQFRNVPSDTPDPNTDPLYGTFSWIGAVVDADENQVGILNCFDLRDDVEILNDYFVKMQIVSEWTEPLVAGETYYGGVRGVDTNGFTQTLIEIQLYPGRVLVP